MRVPIIAACLLAGLAAAYAVTAQATGPVTLPDLPGLGYSLSMQANAQTGCNNYVVIGGNGVTQDFLIGDLPPRCSTAAQEADRIAALLAAYPPAPPTPTTTAQTTTVYVTTAAAPLPPVTTTVALPAVTVAVPVAAPPEVQTRTETVVQTVTVQASSNDTLAVAEPGWLTALTVRSAFLNVVYGLV